MEREAQEVRVKVKVNLHRVKVKVKLHRVKVKVKLHPIIPKVQIIVPKAVRAG